MQFSILSYNTCHNKGLKDLEKILSQCQPDIVTLQELYSNDKNLKKIEKLGYKLADYSNSFIFLGRIYCVATYFNQNRFKLVSARSIFLSRSFHEFIKEITKILIGKGQRRSVLQTNFISKTKNKILIVCNVHLSAFGTNRIRVKQLKQFFDTVQLNNKTPFVIIGDFN